MSQTKRKIKNQVADSEPPVKRNPNSIPNPLSYGSLKIVLEHLEANKRLDFARRCDSIRTADKVVPLKMKVLAFKPMKTIINNKSYKVGETSEECLNTWIFEGRPVIQVKKLEIKSAKVTIRLPPDVKIHAQIIRIHRHVSRTIENLTQILTGSSFPLKTIETFYSKRIEEKLAHSRVQDIGKLVIHDLFDRFPINTKWDRFPQRTHFGTEGILNGNVLSIMKSWKVGKQEIGTWFSVGYSSHLHVSWVMETLEEKLKVEERNRAILFPLDAARDIQVYYEKVDHTEYDSYGASYILNMKVVGK